VRDGVGKSNASPELAGTILRRAPTRLVGHRQEWLMTNKHTAKSDYDKSMKSKTNDKSIGLDMGQRQSIRIDTIDRTGPDQLDGKHASSMLRTLPTLS
jgi:hypothetical protein